MAFKLNPEQQLKIFEQQLKSIFQEIKKEYKFHSKRKWKFDYAIPKYNIAIEVEGGVYTGGRHTRGSGYIKDCEKYNHAALLGWSLYRFTYQTLLTQETLEMLKQALNNKLSELI